VDRSPVVAVLVWLACALAGTCTLGVVALERAAETPRAALGAAPRVALVELGAEPGADDMLAFWERAAQDADLHAERVAVAHLADLSPERFAVWLIAQREDLSDGDWAALDGFAARGGGLVLTGAAAGGADDGAQEHLPLRRLFPGHRFELRDATPAALTAGTRGPLAAGLAPGQRLALAQGGTHLETTTGGALFWGGEPDAGAVLAGLHRGAPAVWIGCPPQWIASREAAERLAGNALRYAAREALVESPAESAIESELRTPREGELVLRARNDGALAARDVALRIYLPAGALRPRLEPPGWFAAQPLVRYASGHAWMELVVAELDPGETVEYTLLF
jgi:hypothetical protein